VADAIETLAARQPGLTAAQISQALFANEFDSGRVHLMCRRLIAEGRIKRRGAGTFSNPFAYAKTRYARLTIHRATKIRGRRARELPIRLREPLRICVVKRAIARPRLQVRLPRQRVRLLLPLRVRCAILIETQPYTAVLVALGIGWLLGRTHRPL
jgi:hypothetical protein